MSLEITVWDNKLKKFYKITMDVNHLPYQFWLANEGGEGMEMKTQAFFEMIDKYFKENY